MLQHGHPWLRQLWQEDQGKKRWGYAIFVNPHWKAENLDRWDSYDRKSTTSMHMAFSAIASGVTIQSRYTVEPLDWPSETPTEDVKLSRHPPPIRNRSRPTLARSTSWTSHAAISSSCSVLLGSTV